MVDREVRNQASDYFGQHIVEAISLERNVLIVLLQLASIVLVHILFNEDERLLSQSDGGTCLLIEPNT